MTASWRLDGADVATQQIRIAEFPDHPVCAATSPTTDDLIALLLHDRAYDPEGDDGGPALVLKGCYRPDGVLLVWIADQCTHSQMSQHLTGTHAANLDEFYVLVRPDYEVDIEARNFDDRQQADLCALMASIDRRTLRSRLGRFRHRPSPRSDGVARYR